jgi:hypothetical protein
MTDSDLAAAAAEFLVAPPTNASRATLNRRFSPPGRGAKKTMADLTRTQFIFQMIMEYDRLSYRRPLSPYLHNPIQFRWGERYRFAERGHTGA